MNKLLFLILMMSANVLFAQLPLIVLISGYPVNGKPTKEEFRRDLMSKSLDEIEAYIIHYCPTNEGKEIKFIVKAWSGGVEEEHRMTFDSSNRKIIRSKFLASAGRGGEKPYPNAGLILLDWEEELIVWKELEVKIQKEAKELRLSVKDSLINYTQPSNGVMKWPLELPSGVHHMKWTLGNSNRDWVLFVPDEEDVLNIQQEWGVLKQSEPNKAIQDHLVFYHAWVCENYKPIKKNNLSLILGL
jgi:hypothetical protein